MTWVLMVYIHYQAGSLTAEFSTRERCEAAGKAFTDRVGSVMKSTGFAPLYVCAEK